MMKKLLISFCLFFAVAAHGFDYGKLYDSVDKQKAAESVDSGKMIEAVSTDGVDYQKAYDSVDSKRLMSSVLDFI
ncbi:MAG: hypothetical protein KZQ64_09285 [gamma proteobacterium symbiont of Bathyaustriella thionipta]|nr:hypothetical protein [gamma proteobacterium symbiont of Bathyaustriella thionipta]MCU7948737.1 hypothetical protein [gamma proteobacterium symbiont of Bathyaustriella thionipta]MCU7953567.1 hypothetical protein [gamma proteobacterium symbiont of Bathyaustriella thionipta]MCU7955220.1 hypothetical protein [gamma proteobacterium symbiont of Bathyaustriella thionipta]MCU7966050.1 hypothetical protein [gamma proteobacterium symbiont of Bathyaustriella thionipta]